MTSCSSCCIVWYNFCDCVFGMAGYDSNRYMSARCRTKVYRSSVKVPKMSNQERAVYEKSRREKIMQEALDFRLMNGWLGAKYPDTIAEFAAFKRQQRGGNPFIKDLTKTVMFHQFVREKTGTNYLGYVLVS